MENSRLPPVTFNLLLAVRDIEAEKAQLFHEFSNFVKAQSTLAGFLRVLTAIERAGFGIQIRKIAITCRDLQGQATALVEVYETASYEILGLCHHVCEASEASDAVEGIGSILQRAEEPAKISKKLIDGYTAQGTEIEELGRVVEERRKDAESKIGERDDQAIELKSAMFAPNNGTVQSALPTGLADRRNREGREEKVELVLLLSPLPAEECNVKEIEILHIAHESLKKAVLSVRLCADSWSNISQKLSVPTGFQDVKDLETLKPQILSAMNVLSALQWLCHEYLEVARGEHEYVYSFLGYEETLNVIRDQLVRGLENDQLPTDAQSMSTSTVTDTN